MRKLFFSAFILMSVHVLAQKELWHKGVAVTAGNVVITGNILFHEREDVIVIRSSDSTHVLNASQLASVRYYDESMNVNRKFVSLTNNAESGKLYEVVLAGIIPVIRHITDFIQPDQDQALGYHYYFIDNGEFFDLRKFRKQLYPKVAQALATQHVDGLNPNQPADAIRLIELFNKSGNELIALR